MTTSAARKLLEPTAVDELARDVSRGLSSSPKTLPCKYLYDRRGSALFDEICELAEYYPTRTELAIMRTHAPAMAHAVGADALLAEYGSGSSIKTRILLDHLRRPAAYVPIDISREHMLATAVGLRADYPGLEVLPVVADFTERIVLPRPRRRSRHTAVYFPGSTIGNLTHPESRRFLASVAELVGPAGGLLIGVDLRKDRSILEPAYDDARGVTAQFNLNLLVRVNRELGGDLDVSAFRHRAIWDADEGRMELSLVSTRDQRATVDGITYRFREGEAIITEYSHKYTLDQFAGLAHDAGLGVREVWTDDAGLFSVQYLSVGR